MKNLEPELFEIARKAARILLGSQLSEHELLMIAIGLETEPEFCHQLSLALGAFVNTGIPEKITRPDDFSRSEANELLAEIKRKRYSKSYVYSAMSAFAPRATKSIHQDSMNMEQMIREFIKRASTEGLSEFRYFIFNGSSLDPYLSRILNKNP